MFTTENDGYYEVYWPRSQRQSNIKPLAKRLESLGGKKVAFLWDFVFRGDEVFGILEEHLKRRFPGITFVNWNEFGNTHGTDERKVPVRLANRI